MMVDRTRCVGNLLLRKRDGHPSVKKSVDQEAEKTRHIFLGNMDAIAGGVEAWFEENTGYSRKVTETAVDIARVLSVPESEINRWASLRSSQDTEKGRVVKSLLARLPGSFLCADDREQ